MHDRYARLQKKYSGGRVGGEKKEMNVMGRGPGGPRGGMHAKGKPKNLGKTVLRMLRYLSHEKGDRKSVV